MILGGNDLRVEQALLTSTWKRGTLDKTSVPLLGRAATQHTSDIYDLPLPKGKDTPEVQAAIRILRNKYDVYVYPHDSQRLGPVLRAEDHVNPTNGAKNAVRLGIILHLANPKAWVENDVPTGRGEQPALNIAMGEPGTLVAQYKGAEWAQRLLKKWGIESVTADSRSVSPDKTKTIPVLRVIGPQNIARLRQMLPTLAEAAQPAPQPARPGAGPAAARHPTLTKS